MNPYGPPPKHFEFRPRAVGEMLDMAFKIWGANWRKLFFVCAAVLLPFQLLSSLVIESPDPTFQEALENWQTAIQEDATATPKFKAEQFVALAIGFILVTIGTYLLTALLTSFVGNTYLGKESETRTLVRTAFRRGPLLLLNFLFALIICLMPFGVAFVVAWFANDSLAVVIASIVLLLIAFVVMIWLWIRLTTASAAIVIEGVGPIHAMRRSWSLVKGRWWPVFGTILLTAIIAAIPSAIISSLVSAALNAIGGDNPGFRFVWTAIGATIGAAIAAPLSAAMSVIVYFDLRIRREGFDLEMLASSLGTPTPAIPQPPTTPPPPSSPWQQ